MERTLRAASRFAQRAIADATHNHYVEALVDAGVALELVAKATLIHNHPLLVIEAPGGQLNLVGMAAALKGERYLEVGVRTISAAEAFRRCEKLVTGFDAKSYNDLLAARNGAVHLGLGEAAQARAALAKLAEAVARLLPVIDIDPMEFWGPFTKSAADRLAEHFDEVRQRVHDLIAAAKTQWHATVATHDAAYLDARRAAGVGIVLGDEQEPYLCPACGELAILDGRLDADVDVDWDYADGESYPVAHPSLVLVPHSLNCLYCHLRLVGRAELDVARIPDSVEVERENITASDILAADYDYDPD